MNVTKKFFVSLAMAVMCLPLMAQKVTVSKESERIKGKNTEGYATELTGALEEVNTSFIKYLKTVGKMKPFSTLPTQITEAEINSVKYTAPIHAVTRAKGAKVLVWIGLDHMADSSQAKSAKKDFEKVVYDFGVKFYRDQIQKDIDESERAQQTAEKKTLQLQNENKSLNSKLEFNQKEKVRLEKALADNKLEYETLLLNIAANKKGQDSVAVATEQIKKMVETHKERQKKVN
jgi:hypothetical protein